MPSRRPSGTSRHGVQCIECDNGQLEASDAVYADCDNCDAAVLRTELGI